MLKSSAMMLVDIVLLAIWTWEADIRHGFVDGLEIDEYGRTKTFYSRCIPYGRGAAPLLLLCFSVNVLYLGAVSYQAYSSNHLVRGSIESRYTAYAVFLIFEAWCIGCIMLFTVRNVPDALYIGLISNVFICCMAVHSFIFFPKILAISRVNIGPHSRNSSRSFLISVSRYFSSEANLISERTGSSDMTEPGANNDIYYDENEIST